MILTLPQTPSGIARVNFDIERVDFGAPQAGGRQGGVQAGWPLWQARFELDRVDPESADLWRAFFARLRGRIRRFYSWDVTRPFPLKYRGGFAGLNRAAGGAFDGSALGWSQTIITGGDARLALTGLPVGLEISVGDYIGFKWDAAGAAAGSFERRTMSRAVLATTAGGGGVAQIIVEPPIDPRVVPAGAIAHFDNPRCVMQLIPEESELGPIGTGAALGGGAILAIQDLRP